MKSWRPSRWRRAKFTAQATRQLEGSRPASSRACGLGLLLVLGACGLLARTEAASSVLLGWSDLGLWEMDGQDDSVFCLMPPYSRLHAQLITGGVLVTNNTGITVTYEAVADPQGSINRTSQGKGNFYQYAPSLFGEALAADEGLGGFAMPGPANVPQAMPFDAAQHAFLAEGIPVTADDDQGQRNNFPMMRLVARNAAGTILASTEVVLPVTDQLDCRGCHASGAQAAARPPEGWAWEVNPDRDYKLNILRSHDDHLLGEVIYSNVLSEVGYSLGGLVATVLEDGQPVLCARCHSSAALPGTGATGMRPMTEIIHTRHAYVADPVTDAWLTTVTNSGACLNCHAGPETLLVRGVHHNTINGDGTRAMQCQNCHGSITQVGTAGRQGWLDEPLCQSCHTGTATTNAGALRYTSVFDDAGNIRVAADTTFATPRDTPSAGVSLFRASQGHGGLACAACHGSAHAEVLSLQTNDNVQATLAQGHTGVLLDCATCHPTSPASLTSGPHGMHPANQSWTTDHGDASRGGIGCRPCHGTDERGTVLSRADGARSFSADGSRQFWQGFQVGCYTCHNGPSGEGGNPNIVATVSNLAAATVAGTPVTVPLPATDRDGDALTLRVVTQPAHGTVSLQGSLATYWPDTGFAGTDTFTFAAWDQAADSNLGTAAVTVTPGTCALTLNPLVPAAAFPNQPTPFRVTAQLSGCAGDVACDWDFGDGSVHGSGVNVAHTYSATGDFPWTLTATVGAVSQTATGVLTISPTLGPPLTLSQVSLGFMVLLAWPADNIPTSLETSYDLTQPYGWQPLPGTPYLDQANWTVTTFMLPGQQFFRLRRVP